MSSQLSTCVAASRALTSVASMLPLTSNSSAMLTPPESLRKSVIGSRLAAVEDLEVARRQILDEATFPVADDGR